MKILFVLLISFLSVMLFGAYQYNTKGNQTWLTFDSDTNLYFEIDRSGKDKEHENFIDKGKGIADWGWYNLNTNESGSFKDGNSFAFTENDKIALWVKDEQGNVYSSTKNVSNFIWGKSDVKDDIFKIYGGNKGSNGTHEYYFFKVTSAPSNNTPTGQPLPGIIATLIVGGGGIFYLKKRKKLLIK